MSRANSDRDVLRRSIVLPTDLFYNVEQVARAARWSSVQTFVVAELQRIVNRRLPDEEEQ